MWNIAIPLAMGGMSMLQAQQQQKNQARANQASMLANAAAMEYSPWTGMGKEMIAAQPAGGTGDVLAKGIQGGLMGAMFAKQLGGAPNSAAANAAAKADAFVDGIAANPANFQAPKPAQQPMGMSPWSGMLNQNTRRPSLYGSGNVYA